MKELFETGVLKWAIIALVVFLGLQSLSVLQEMRYAGAGIQPSNVITVSGYGEVSSVPNIATFNFSVVSLKPTVASAQEDASKKSNAIASYLKEKGVAERDIQTSNYSIYPQYEWQRIVCVTYPCSDGKQVLKGYEVRQSTTVKVRDTSKAGDLLAGIGSLGATEVSGLNFTFDDPQAVEDEARGKAIADAKQKAKKLASQLGVRIVRVVSFNENGGGYPYPLAYGMGGDAQVKVSAPEISVGENKVTSNVSVTYEIR
jgi:uncharacterized protein